MSYKQYLIKVEGFLGPYENKYLSGYSPGYSDKKYRTLTEAKKECLKAKYCSGITYTRQGYFTLRKNHNLLNPDPQNRFKNKEITWIKNTDFIENSRINENIDIIKENNIVIKEITNFKNVNEEDIYEIIKIKNKDYYYNIKSRKILNLKGIFIGKLVKGKLILN